VPLAVLAVIALVHRVGRSRTARGNAGRPRPHEIAAVAAFAALPVMGVVVGLTLTGAFPERYALRYPGCRTTVTIAHPVAGGHACPGS
jgi:predicted Na+-dependent transporter